MILNFLGGEAVRVLRLGSTSWCGVQGSTVDPTPSPNPSPNPNPDPKRTRNAAAPLDVLFLL